MEPAEMRARTYGIPHLHGTQGAVPGPQSRRDQFMFVAHASCRFDPGGITVFRSMIAPSSQRKSAARYRRRNKIPEESGLGFASVGTSPDPSRFSFIGAPIHPFIWKDD